MFKKPIQEKFVRLKSLNLKFILTILPLFVLFSAISLLLLSKYDSQGEIDRLTARVGNLAARVSSALARNSAEQNIELAQDLMTALGSDTAVVCAEVQKKGQLLAGIPAKVGCKGQVLPNQINLQINEDDPDLNLLIAYTFVEVDDAVRLRFSITLATLILGLVITLVSSSISFNRIVGRRLLLLRTAISRAKSSGERLEVPSGARDQLGEIIDAYNEMVQWENSRENVLLAENSNLEQKTKEEQLIRRRLEFQLETAQVFQKLLLPSPVVHEEISSCFFYAPAEKIGGDWFTYLLDEREEVFYTIIIDVTGHGLVSAMLASFLSGIVAAHFEDNIATKDSTLRLKILSEKINRVLFSSSAQSGMAATGLLLAVDKNQGSIFYINCGHPPILIKQESTFEIIPSSGRRLGIVRESDFEVQRIPLLGDGRLFTYTDGLIDNCSDHPFKMSSRHLKKLLDKTVELNVEDAKHLLQSHFENHFEKSLENDDATFILIDWNLAKIISEESPPDVPPGEHKD